MPKPRRTRRSSRPTGSAWALIIALVVLAGVVVAVALDREIKGYLRPFPSVAIAPASPQPSPAPGLSSLIPLASPAPLGTGPKVAIIIDDCGYSIARCRAFLDLPIPLTLSILPMTPHGKQTEADAKAAGKYVMLHLPMEAMSPQAHPGPGAILTRMSDAQVQAQVVADIDFLPDIAGANNHMGSKASSDPRVMRDVLNVFARRHLFFIDSMTSMTTVGAQTARELGIPTAERDVFLDDSRDLRYIKGQLETLQRVALRQGNAIAIGHPFPTTVRALREAIPMLEARGIRFVPAQVLVK